MVSESEKVDKFSKHPIQLVALKVLELTISVNPEFDQEQDLDPKWFALTTGHSKYDDENRTIPVKVKAQIKSEEGNAPFDLLVELLGIFEVDDQRFPITFVEDWARRNAPLILYPYLREQVYSLTSRCGFEGALLPLLELPTFKLPPQNSS